jgi:hypothetical protein
MRYALIPNTFDVGSLSQRAVQCAVNVEVCRDDTASGRTRWGSLRDARTGVRLRPLHFIPSRPANLVHQIDLESAHLHEKDSTSWLVLGLC